GAVIEANAQTASLNSFFIAAHAVSEAAPGWAEDIFDVQQAASGSSLRHIRFEPAAEVCPNNVAIRALEKRTNLAPSRLVGAENLCAIKPQDFQAAMERVALKGPRTGSGTGYTVVAICGAEENVFEVPTLGTFDLKALHEQLPGAAQIVELYSEVEKRVFPNDNLSGGKHSKDKELQASAQKLLPVLKSGRFDKGFASSRLKDLLSMYQGPISGMQPVPK